MPITTTEFNPHASKRKGTPFDEKPSENKGGLGGFLEQTNLPVSQRSLGHKILASVLAGFDESGEIARSIRSREEEERKAGRRQSEREEDREFRKGENEKSREFKERLSEEERAYKERREEFKRTLKLQDERQSQAFDVVSDALKDLPDDDPRRQKIIQNFAEKYGPENAEVLNNISLSTIDQQKVDNESQRIANTSRSNDIAAQRLETDEFNAKTNRINAENASNNAQGTTGLSGKQLDILKERLSTNETFSDLDDGSKTAFAFGVNEVSQTLKRNNPQMSDAKAVDMATLLLNKKGVNKKGMFRDSKFDASKSAKVTQFIKDNGITDIQVGEDGKLIFLADE